MDTYNDCMTHTYHRGYTGRNILLKNGNTQICRYADCQSFCLNNHVFYIYFKKMVYCWHIIMIIKNITSVLTVYPWLVISVTMVTHVYSLEACNHRDMHTFLVIHNGRHANSVVHIVLEKSSIVTSGI